VKAKRSPPYLANDVQLYCGLECSSKYSTQAEQQRVGWLLRDSGCDCVEG
jgi:hypothetical protein